MSEIIPNNLAKIIFLMLLSRDSLRCRDYFKNNFNKDKPDFNYKNGYPIPIMGIEIY